MTSDNDPVLHPHTDRPAGAVASPPPAAPVPEPEDRPPPSPGATDQARRPTTWGEDFAFFFEHRYLVLCAVVLLFMVSYLAKNTWAGAVDIWEHAAAARELAERPFDPRHPLLSGVDRPHQFFSPYHLAIGLSARVTGVSVVTAFSVAAIANLILLFVGLRLFVQGLGLRPHTDFWALLFMLFLWGPGAWIFSGFHHFDVLALVVSYPSIFVKGLVFISFWAHLKYLRSAAPRWLLPTLAVSAVVLLAHPVNAIALGIGVLALTWTADVERRDRALVLTVATLALSLLLAMLWPYYSLYGLLFGEATEGFRTAGDVGDRDMYVDVVKRLCLALVVVPFLFRRLERWRSDPLALMFVGLLAAYGYGYFTEDWSYGRLIAQVQIVAAIILADERARVGEMAMALGEAGRPILRWIQVTTAALVLAGVFFLRNGFDVLPERIMEDVPYHWVHGYVDPVKLSDFSYLARNHKSHPVVISDPYTSLEVPTFGSKVVDAARAQAFVVTADRGQDLGRFYDPASSQDVRREVIAKYDVSLLIVAVVDLNNDPTKFRPLLELGREVARNQRFVFVDLRRP
ncbi:MAG TPA: hypothetical protein VHF27_03675 [Acidimicrobiales bacterium]|nr:hypothetical protein [Acidimicrobiales bacterium]